jgi:hypothetical protein
MRPSLRSQRSKLKRLNKSPRVKTLLILPLTHLPRRRLEKNSQNRKQTPFLIDTSRKRRPLTSRLGRSTHVWPSTSLVSKMFGLRHSQTQGKKWPKKGK